MDIISSLESLQLEFTEEVGKMFSVFQEKTIENHYIDIQRNGGMEILPVNTSEIAQDFSNKLANEFRKKMESLKRVVDFAEEEARKYQWDSDLKAEDVSYINSKELLDNSTLLTDHALFKTKVIANQSSVHIPTEIYKEDPLVLNTIKWASKLDSIFPKFSKDIRYLYFASFTGIVFQYPGMKWRKKGTDMFDVRRRQWYVQGASSPKDVMILIDTSGSMHGIAIKLTKSAVQKLIDTMGENDYIAVAQFPGSKEKNVIAPHLIYDYQGVSASPTPCFQTFVQANKRNKDRLFKQISDLKARGIAHLDDALEFAINEFHKFDNLSRRGNEGANCNRLIVVFTDSGDEYDREKIRSLINRSNTTKNLRIFIYYVGEEITPIDTVENRTCDYRGYFGHIHAMGAVSSIIDKYSTTLHYHTIHRENKLDDNEFRIDFAAVDEDGFHNPDDFPYLGLGLMTSLTMPVYNRSGNGSFLGLLGTDMTVAFMDELIPHDKLGPNGYAFSINTNGYIIFHPGLKNQLGWMRDPPNVDFAEIEFDSDQKNKIRSKMIDCAASNGTLPGQDDVLSLIKVPDEIHTYEKVKTYSYVGVPYSTFGITIVNSKYNRFYPQFFSNIKFIKLLECTHAQCSMIISLPSEKKIQLQFTNDVFLYSELGLITRCKINNQNNNIFPTNTASTSSVNLNHKYATSTSGTETKMQKSATQIVPLDTIESSISSTISIIQSINMSTIAFAVFDRNKNVTTDFQVTKFSEELLKILSHLQNQSDDKCPNYESRRLISDLYVLEKIEKFLKKPDMISSLIISTLTGLTMVYPKSEKHVYKDLFDNFTNSAIFQRTFDMEQFIFYTSLDNQDDPKESQPSLNDTYPDIMVFKSFSATIKKDQTIPISVLGLSWKQSSIVNILQKYTACNKSRICYLLEDGGYIISVNDMKLLYQVGKFFGKINPSVMETLMNNSIFKSVEDYDYQAICPKEKEEESSSSSNRLKPLNDLIMFPMFLFKTILLYMENLFLFIKLFAHLMFLHLSSAQEATATDNKNTSCIKKYHRFYFDESSVKQNPKEITQTCENCTFSLFVTKITSTNLILISYDQLCSTNCNVNIIKKLNRYPMKSLHKNSEPDICQLSNEPRYRLRPNYKCYGFNPDEDFMKCNSQKLQFISTTLSSYLPTFILAITSRLFIINDLHL